MLYVNKLSAAIIVSVICSVQASVPTQAATETTLSDVGQRLAPLAAPSTGIDWLDGVTAVYAAPALVLATHQKPGTPATPAKPRPQAAGAASGLAWNSGAACHYPSFDAFRGRGSDVYVAFVGRTSRRAVIDQIRSDEIGRFAGMPGTLSLSWPMLPTEIAHRFAECTRGDYDQFVRDGANALKGHGFANPIVRLGWEVNGKYPWSLGPRPDLVEQYKACFQRQVNLFRSILPNVQIEWSNRRDGEIPYSIERAYPGDAYVDIIAMMLYDRWPIHPDQQAWSAAYSRTKFGGPFGFASYLAFARERNKKLAISEWGISNNDNDPKSTDNPFYIQKMYDLFRENASDIAYEAYFNCGPATEGYKLAPNTINPKAAAKYQELWRKDFADAR